MESKRDLAIVLRVVAYEDRHRIVTALTEQNGLISAMARNSIQSRRFGGCLDQFAASEWLFVEKPGTELVRLDEAHIRRAFDGLRKDFERLSMASVFSEFMLKIAPKGEACPDLFKLHSNALATLEELPGTGASLPLLNAYLAKLLQWSGSQPQLLACLGCQRPLSEMNQQNPLSCLIADAAWVCGDCRTVETRHVRERQGEGFQALHLRVSPMAILDFQLSISTPIRQMPTQARASEPEHRELFKFIEALVVYHLPGFDKTPLKSLRFLNLESTLPHPAANPR